MFIGVSACPIVSVSGHVAGGAVFYRPTTKKTIMTKPTPDEIRAAIAEAEDEEDRTLRCWHCKRPVKPGDFCRRCGHAPSTLKHTA